MKLGKVEVVRCGQYGQCGQCVMMDVCGEQGTAGLLKLSPSVTVTVPLPDRDSCS